MVEVVISEAETYEKFGFYSAHDVDEIMIADPEARVVRLFERDGGRYIETNATGLLGAVILMAKVDWPR